MSATILPDSSLARGAEGTAVRLRIWQKVLLILALVWALVVITPDFYRIAGDLAAFGFSADNSGLIYKVDNPLPGGLAVNDHIRLKPGPCWVPWSDDCRDLLAVFGGMGGLSYVRQGTKITLPIVRNNGDPGEVSIAAQPAPLDRSAEVVLFLDEIAAMIVIWLAFKLVWDRPGLMTLGVFLYAMWFNPGQYFAFYAWLQPHPVLLLTQEALQAMAQGAGYAGFAIFALRFPHDRTEPKLEGLERVAVGLGAGLALLQLLSFANVFGYPTELVTRTAILGGYAVAFWGFFIVRYRMRFQQPLDYQRMRWVLWGCAIGIPAFIFADSNEATSLWSRFVWTWPIWQGWSPSETVFEFGYLLSGLFTLFVCIAVRHRRILNVTPELRALAASGLVLILGLVVEDAAQNRMTAMFSSAGISDSLQFYLSILPLVLISVGTHRVSHSADHLFNRDFYHAEGDLEEIGAQAMHAETIADVDAILLKGPLDTLHLASGAVFREIDGAYSLMCKSESWDEHNPAKLDSFGLKRLMNSLSRGDLVRLPAPLEDEDLTDDILAPALAVPVLFAGKLNAVAMYGAHVTGADLDRLEVKLLEGFARQIAVGYEKVTKMLLEREIQELREELAKPRDVNS